MNKYSADVVNSRMYVALYPCNECAKMIIQSGIKEVIYLSDKYHDTNTCKASRTMFEMAGVKTRRYIPLCFSVSVDFGDIPIKEITNCGGSPRYHKQLEGGIVETNNASTMRRITYDKSLAGNISVNEEANNNKKKNGTTNFQLGVPQSQITNGNTCCEIHTKPTLVGPRKNALSWYDYFMSIAFLSAMRSKDPSTQVGACIVNQSNRIVGIGYNGFPVGCSDNELPWDRTGDDELDTKYPFVCHAEVNAMNKR